MNWFVSPARLRAAGVLGMNARNIRQIAAENKRKYYPIVDDKTLTKKAAMAAGITVPKLIGVVDNMHDVRDLAAIIGDQQQFVIKPTRGSGGKGILVIVRREDEYFIKPSGMRLKLDDLKRDVSNILSGLYSLGGKPDKALIEELILFDDQLQSYSYEGVPDIRVIIFRGYPVMAMIRCPTHASDGKANLHQGGVGVGLDIATGRATYATQYNRKVMKHPDTGIAFEELRVPQWEELLVLASRCYELTKMGYIGCDIVIDKRYGPMILELNARPGLAIQIANQTGLKHRLDKVRELKQPHATQAEKVAWAMAEFRHPFLLGDG